jgi:methyl-accepting chemotaxis protein
MAARIWIGFGIAAGLAALLGGLASYAAARGATGWAVAAVVLAAAGIAGVGAWVVSSAAGGARAFSSDVRRVAGALSRGDLSARSDAGALPAELRPASEALNAALDQLARAAEAAADGLSALTRGELPAGGRCDLDLVNGALDDAGKALGALLEDARALAAAAGKDRLEARRAEGRQQPGAFGEALRDLAAGYQALAERAHWYEQILDAVPFPLSVTDKDMRWTFINAPVEKLLGVRRKDVLGKACESWNADICRTESCGVARLRKGQLVTSLKQKGLTFRVDTGYLANSKGETVGHVEVMQDITLLTSVTEYQREELGRLGKGLVQMAAGDLSVDLKVGDGDEHTREVRQHFLATAASLDQVRSAVASLVRDSTRVAEAAVAGRLAERADVAAHQGDYRKVVEGLNRTLDAVAAPIQEAAQVLEALAQRNLRARVEGAHGGELGRIRDSVNAAGAALHDALAQVSEAVEQVSSAASQIASSSQAVASGASEQAASLEETSSSIELVASMTKQSADNAQQANHLAGTARTAAGEGTAAVEQMQSAMARIKASAEGTSQIIRDINDIAFQTNLLALNAAVEAARAGEAGRGFAVVAEEVRSLALRAKEAAQKTEELIRQSVKEAAQGEVTAKQVAGKLSEIAGGISKVTDIISEIAAGAAEQASGIDQVNRAVGEMDRVTQQNAASAEESSSAASELSGQAEQLASMIGSFRLERSGGRRAAASLPAPARAPARAFAPPAARSTASTAPAPQRNGAPSPKDADALFPMDDPSDDVRDF